jgi:hypothetical protein
MRKRRFEKPDGRRCAQDFWPVSRQGHHRPGISGMVENHPIPHCSFAGKVRSGAGGAVPAAPAERPLSVQLRDLSSGRKATGEMRRERTTANVRFQPEFIARDREMLS